MKLYSYFRSSASYRVRIALALKGLEYDFQGVHLRRNEQNAKEFLAVNPQGLVPALVDDDGAVLTAHNQQGVIVGAGSIYEQARHCFEKIQYLMEAAGGKMNDIVKVNIYVVDITKREDVWKARREFFTGDFPCSTLVEVSALAPPGILVEVEGVGFLGSSA